LASPRDADARSEPGRLGSNDPPQEVAHITGDGTTYALTLSNSANPTAPGAFTSDGLGSVTPETPFRRGIFRFDSPFGTDTSPN